MLLELTYRNHHILGNLELKFTNDKGEPYKNILFIGENGSGKSTVLRSIADSICGGSIISFSHIKYQVDGKTYVIDIDEKRSVHCYEVVDGTTLIPASNNYSQQGCSYSSSKTNFQVNSRNLLGKYELDKSIHERDDSEDGSIIISLLSSLKRDDSDDFIKLNELECTTSFSEYRKTGKLSRLLNAFNRFFKHNIELSKIDDSDYNNIMVSFEKNGKPYDIDSLSSGEKQIVFRCSRILKNINNRVDGVVLIDEPELNLHPRWQHEIQNFYKEIFTIGGEQKTQIFYATHSTDIVNAAFKSLNDTLVIKLSNSKDGITCTNISENSVLPFCPAAETNYLVFGTDLVEYHVLLYGYLQFLLGDISIKRVDQYIQSSPWFDNRKHFIHTQHESTDYYTLPTKLRNDLSHPQTAGLSATDETLICSIELLRAVIKDFH